MSQLPHGILLPPPAPAVAPRLASAVVLWRDGPRGRELFWVRRGAPLRFAAGFFAFPGGRIDREDAHVPVRGETGERASAVAAAARELFEEAGVLVADGAAAVPRPERDAARRALLAGELAFGDFLSRQALEIDAADFIPAGRWVTPPVSPIRFDARTFLVRFPAGERAEVWPGELSAGEWISTGDALARWSSGEVLLHPPNLWPIVCLDRAPPPACLDAMRAPPQVEDGMPRRIEFQRGVFHFPVRTPTLPPATHTNVIMPVVEGGLAIIDPGSPWPEEQAALERFLDELAAEGLPPREIWLTHAHADHVGGAARLRARYRIPLRAHPDAAARLPADAGGAEPLAGGELLAGRWRVHHTPGHALGHLVFHDERSGALVAGDMVSSLSTIVIDPPEGDMARYLASLEQLRALGPRTLYPAHGPPAPDGPAKLEEYVAHRRMREEKVLAALASPGTLAEVTARAYDDTPAAALPIAARSCLASLEKLRAEGRAREERGAWRLA
ncbi:MAG TPA: MBL fold metallo-hydrolase [Anaeromyxobacteraceae bacterium]|nr:MBL fold metallo-hydrolase [Anaeromyxobacteraceae bacterium]